MLHNIFLVVQLLSAIGLVGLVLLQHGKGAEVGASFGGGASQTVFGSSGSGSFLSRVTAIFVVIFFSSSLFLAYVTKKQISLSSELQFSPQNIENLDLPHLPNEVNSGQNESDVENLIDLPPQEMQQQDVSQKTISSELENDLNNTKIIQQATDIDSDTPDNLN